MRYKYDLSPLEKMVFDILLESENNLGYEDIIKLMPSEREWNDKSVYTALNHLKKNGLIRESGKIKVARTRAILYSATMTKDEFYEAAYSEYFEKMQHNSLSCILSALTGSKRGRDQEVVNEVEAWLQNQKEMLDVEKEDTDV